MISIDRKLTTLQLGILDAYSTERGPFTTEELMRLTGTFSRHAVDVSSRDLAEKGYLVEVERDVYDIAGERNNGN